MKKIKIKNKIISDKSPCFIIAEAGVNHNGNVKLAKKLIDVAKDAGADAVKFQTYKTEELVAKKIKKNYFETLKRLELPYETFNDLKEYCDKRKIIFLSTPHCDNAIDFLEQLVPAYKIASGDLTNLPFLEKVAKKKKPIILSTGTSTLNEVKEAVRAIKKA